MKEMNYDNYYGMESIAKVDEVMRRVHPMVRSLGIHALIGKPILSIDFRPIIIESKVTIIKGNIKQGYLVISYLDSPHFNYIEYDVSVVSGTVEKVYRCIEQWIDFIKEPDIDFHKERLLRKDFHHAIDGSIIDSKFVYRISNFKIVHPKII